MAVQGPEDEELQEPKERSFFANIFEHTIDRYNDFSIVPRKEAGKGGIDWPSFYTESIYDPVKLKEENVKKIQWTKVGKKIGFFALGAVIGIAIGAAIVSSGGAAIPGGAFVAMLVVGTFGALGGLTLPTVPFMIKTALRVAAKPIWIAAGLLQDVLDNVFRKGPQALMNAVRGKKSSKGSEPDEEFEAGEEQEEEEEAAAKKSFPVRGVPDLEFSVSDGPNGKKVYTPNKNIDELTEDQLKALVRSSKAHYQRNGGKQGGMNFNMIYSLEEVRIKRAPLDEAIVKAESGRITAEGMSVTQSPTGNDVDAFNVSKDPEGKRIYTPLKKWEELTGPQKENIVREILAYEAYAKTQPNADTRSSIDVGPDNITELKSILNKLGHVKSGVAPAAATSAPAASHTVYSTLDRSKSGLGAFDVETAKEQRIYTPRQNWSELTRGDALGSKRRLVREMIAYEDAQPNLGSGLDMLIIIKGVGGTPPTVLEQQEVNALYHQLRGLPAIAPVTPAAAPAPPPPPAPGSPPPALAVNQPGRIVVAAPPTPVSTPAAASSPSSPDPAKKSGSSHPRPGRLGPRDVD